MSAFQEIIDAWLDGAISADQIQLLTESLRSSADCRQEFASQVQLQTMLRESYASDACFATAMMSPLADEEALPSASTVRNKFGRYMFIAFVASLLVAVLSLFRLPVRGFVIPQPQFASTPASATPAADVLATAPSTIATVVKSTMAGLEIGQPFFQHDRIIFDSGLASLRFTLGVTADLVGPVDMEFISENRVLLHRGQVTADVDPSAVGFTIETPHVDIIDLGTKFGVNVQKSGGADVVVFSGAVDINYKRPPDSQAAIARYERLEAGEAIHIKGGRSFHRIPVVQTAGHSGRWSTKIKEAESRLASSISDNFPESSRPIYYHLVAGGFDEDALSYVDRPYEWNSVPGLSFPDPLRGGDYIRMMNALKFVMNLEVKIELRQPVDIYILMDRRAPPPAWLTAGFTKTDMVIGMDEYDPKKLFGAESGDAMRTLGIGAGQSVDQIFDIWVKRNYSAPAIVLGSLVEPEPTDPASNHPKSPLATTGISMYGVILTAPTLR